MNASDPTDTATAAGAFGTLIALACAMQFVMPLLLPVSFFMGTSAPIAALAPFVYSTRAHAEATYFPFWLGLILELLEWGAIGAVFGYKSQGKSMASVLRAAPLVVLAVWMGTMVLLLAVGVDAGRIHN
jgi:hypothetical protein